MPTLSQTLTDARTAQQIVADYERYGAIGLMRRQNDWIEHHPWYQISAGIDVLAMTAQFMGGFGPDDHYFGPASTESRLMAQTPDFAYALQQFLSFHDVVVRPRFRFGGYWRSGANPTAQFVGGFTVFFTVSGRLLFARLENVTSFGSFMADAKWAFRKNHDRTHWGGLMANTQQSYIIALRLQ